MPIKFKKPGLNNLRMCLDCMADMDDDPDKYGRGKQYYCKECRKKRRDKKNTKRKVKDDTLIALFNSVRAVELQLKKQVEANEKTQTLLNKIAVFLDPAWKNH